MKRTPEELAGDLYTVYCNAVGNVSYDGKPLPRWEDFIKDPTKVKQSAAWIRVAESAIFTLTKM